MHALNLTPAHSAKSMPFAAKRMVGGLVALAALCLSACAVTPQQPKYPIYMQERPAGEMTAAEQKALADKAAADKAALEESTGVTGLGSKGEITSTELPPPPPPPPPAEMVAQAPTAKPAPRPTPKPVVTAPTNAQAGFVYVLQAKDTLYGVSRRFGVPIKSLYELNGLTPDAVTKIGQKITLPDTAKDKGVEAYASGPGLQKITVAQVTPVKPAPVAEKPVEKPVVTPPAAKPVPAPVQTVAKGFPDNAGLRAMGSGKFIWPYKGPVLVRFGQLAPNVRNDGLNIGGPDGAEVVAAREGTIVYVGDQVKELGNTVYIKHADGFYTGYSHLGKVNVKTNQTVTQGQAIGTLGRTGAVDKPQLHFEIRYTPSAEIAKPIDPVLVLP